MPTVLITGSSRGIGLEFTRAYAAKGWQVLATCRKPVQADALQALAAAHKNISLHALDVADEASITALAAALQGQPIDLLINNAGIGGAGVELGALDLNRWRTLFDTNVLGPAKLTDLLLPNLLAGNGRMVVSISSTLGSIARSSGGNYAYRSTKAALNMTMRSMALDLAPRGIVSVLMSPGIVDTDFTRGGRMPKIPVGDSVAGMMRVIEGLKPEQAGQFLRYSGETVEW
ncbi:MAG: SDR family oxidoreductase [Rhodospirillaceae bacterium]|nr:SDR family oxidoreductase [Rhodospirillaceae bacterium]